MIAFQVLAATAVMAALLGMVIEDVRRHGLQFHGSHSPTDTLQPILLRNEMDQPGR